MSITYQTRNNSYEAIQGQMTTRQEQCVSYLRTNGESTANELADKMFRDGLTENFQRNYAHPRLNELVSYGLVEVVGKKKDRFSGRTVAVYKLVSNNN